MIVGLLAVLEGIHSTKIIWCDGKKPNYVHPISPPEPHSVDEGVAILRLKTRAKYGESFTFHQREKFDV